MDALLHGGAVMQKHYLVVLSFPKERYEEFLSVYFHGHKDIKPIYGILGKILH